MPQAQKWKVWQDAEDRAARMWSDPSVSPQAKRAACWEAECAKQQWMDAADAEVAQQKAA